MKLRALCIRCRRDFAHVEIQGGVRDISVGMNAFLGGPTICADCGGSVWQVSNEQALPYEFVPTPRRVARAAIWSSIKTAAMWALPTAAITAPIGDAWLQGWHLTFLAVSAVVGFALPWAQAAAARNRPDINVPHKAGGPGLGEAAILVFSTIPAIAIGVGAFVFVAPYLAGGEAGLRGTTVRSIVGAVVGLLTASVSCRELFRHGRVIPTGKLRRPGARYE